MNIILYLVDRVLGKPALHRDSGTVHGRLPKCKKPVTPYQKTCIDTSSKTILKNL